MRAELASLLRQARAENYAIGAFNIYNLEGARAVVEAAEQLNSPIILQLLPAAISHGGTPLLAMCLELARTSSVQVAVHLDHCADEELIRQVVSAGLTSVMADGSALPYEENIAFTRRVCRQLLSCGGGVEAELGRLSGEEDGLSVAAKEARLTDPLQAREFVAETGVAALAVCIGNVHGTYQTPPKLDWTRLQMIASQVEIPLVLHGTSGLPDEMITEALRHGVCKFNINTELRVAYLQAIRDGLESIPAVELLPLLKQAVTAMQAVVTAKILLFQSAGKSR